jgi:SAM-dependent methyltransferase
MSADASDALVHAHYEALPYPHRDPADEARRLIEGSPSGLAEVIHCVFAGKRRLSDPLRVLVAGGGTGDATIMLAQHMADARNPGTIDYIDLSRAARAVCEARAQARGLTNIRFHSGSLLDVAAIAPGPFDYVDCCGVLHHLNDPAAGLRALVSVLAESGGMGLMVYAPYGREGVYPMQALLRSLTPEDRPPGERLAVAKSVLAALPPTNQLARNPVVQDHRTGGDAGLYDLLLHSRDRAYTIDAFEDLLAEAGLGVAAMAEAVRYDPGAYVSDPALLNRLAALSARDRRAFCEVAAGTMNKHVVYAVPRDRAEQAAADPADLSLVPGWIGAPVPGAGFKPGQALSGAFDGVRLRRALPDGARPILDAVDGVRDGAAVVAHAAKTANRPRKAARADYDATVRALIDLGKVRLTRGR